MQNVTALKTQLSPRIAVNGRLRIAELIPEAAEALQAGQITAGHAVLIARPPQERQRQALEAAFLENCRSKDKHWAPAAAARRFQAPEATNQKARISDWRLTNAQQPKPTY